MMRKAGMHQAWTHLVHVWVTIQVYIERVYFYFFNWCSFNICSLKIALPYLVIVTQYT